jgi:hypothetical protein
VRVQQGLAPQPELHHAIDPHVGELVDERPEQLR